MKGRVGLRVDGLLLDRAPDGVAYGPKGGETPVPRWWAQREDGEVVEVDDASLPAVEVEHVPLW